MQADSDALDMMSSHAPSTVATQSADRGSLLRGSAPSVRGRCNVDDPFLNHYFKRIDPEIAHSFTSEQRMALKVMFSARDTARHSVELRKSIGLPGWRFYLVLLMGRDRRGVSRLHDGPGQRPLTHYLMGVFRIAMFFLPGLALALLLQLW